MFEPWGGDSADRRRRRGGCMSNWRSYIHTPRRMLGEALCGGTNEAWDGIVWMKKEKSAEMQKKKKVEEQREEGRVGEW